LPPDFMNIFSNMMGEFQQFMGPGAFAQGPHFQNFNFHHHGHHETEEEEEDVEYEEEEEEPKPSPEEIKAVINSYAAFKFEEKKGEEVNCAICLDKLKGGQMVKALNCTHKYHSKCINDWLKQQLRCPLCKESVV